MAFVQDELLVVMAKKLNIIVCHTIEMNIIGHLVSVTDCNIVFALQGKSVAFSG